MVEPRLELNALNSGNMSNLYDCENKRYSVFDKEMANAVMKCYKVLSNADRQVFNGIFRKMWESSIGSQDLMKENSILGFEKLKAMMEANCSDEQYNDYGLKAALGKAFIQSVTKIIDSLKAQD